MALRALVGAGALLVTAGVGAQGFGLGLPVDKPGLQPGVRASATWSDNVGHRSGGGDSDVVLEVSPYITAYSNRPRASYRLFYQLRNFLRVQEGDTNFLRHALDAQGSFALVDDRLWLDVTGFMGTINASPTGAISSDPASSFSNTTNVRHFSISPWYRDRLGNFANYQLRYALAHTGGNSGFLTAKLDHRASAQIDGIPSDSPWNWRAYGEMQVREFNGGISRERRTSGAALYYRLRPNLRVYGTVDYEEIENLRNKDGDESGWGPGVGFDWQPFVRTSLSGSISDRYYGTIGHLSATQTFRRSTFGLRYSRSVLTSADASLLLFDPMSITSGGFGFGQTNPVINSLISSGIVFPPGTVFTQGLFTDAAVLDRRLTAFWGLRGARNALTVSVFLSNRESTTEFASTTAVSGIRGVAAIGGIFTGELRERGVATTYQHRLDGRSAVDVTLDLRRNDSPTADFETRLTTFRVGYRTWLTSDLSAFAGMRRTVQSGEGRSASYDENAVFGGVDVRFY